MRGWRGISPHPRLADAGKPGDSAGAESASQADGKNAAPVGLERNFVLEVVKDPALLERIERGKARRKGLYSGGARCPACHAPGLETTSRQARAGDEGRTVQVSCPSCHYSKTFNT